MFVPETVGYLSYPFLSSLVTGLLSCYWARGQKLKIVSTSCALSNWHGHAKKYSLWPAKESALNVCVLLKFLYWNSNTRRWWYSRRWGLWGVLRSWGWGHREWDSFKKKKRMGLVPYKRSFRKPLDFPFHPGKRQDEGCHQHMIMLMPWLRLPSFRTLRNTFSVVYKLPSVQCFVTTFQTCKDTIIQVNLIKWFRK